MTYLDDNLRTSITDAVSNGTPLALVTGAAGGIGAGTVRTLLDDGFAVIATDVAKEALVRVHGEDQPDLLTLAVHDVSSERGWEAVVAPVQTSTGRLDVLVNNAGILQHRATMAEIPVADFQRIMDINLVGTLLGVQACVPLLRYSDRGSIINISSAEAYHATAGFGAYATSKWAVRGLTKAVAVELAPEGIRCNSVHPWGVSSGMTQGADGNEPLERLLASIPMGRVGAPAEAGALVSFLASPQSGFSTGAEFVIDGGAIATSGY